MRLEQIGLSHVWRAGMVVVVMMEGLLFARNNRMGDWFWWRGANNLFVRSLSRIVLEWSGDGARQPSRGAGATRDAAGNGFPERENIVMYYWPPEAPSSFPQP